MSAEELYDLDDDPHEIHNLATCGDPKCQTELARLRAILDRWIEESHDQGKELEPVELASAKGMTKPKTHPQTGYGPRGTDGVLNSP